ncbi:MAG: hypothetical protein AAF211_17355 [Myxococcota bacterium]
MASDAPLDDDGLSATARRILDPEVCERVAEAWGRGRALILNANKPGYSEAFTIAAEQYTLLRDAILEAVDDYADAHGEVSLKQIVAHVDATLASHAAFPTGRMTNYTRYTKTDLEARGELERVPKRSPQRVRRPAR